MSDRFLVATRKGLFTIQRGPSRLSPWSIAATAFLGDNVSMMLADPRDGTMWAALDHGHFGAKLHLSRDEGATWTEAASPAFPPSPKDKRRSSRLAAGPFPGAYCGSGRWNPEVTTIPGVCGVERFPADCFAPMTGALPGIWSGPYGITPSGGSGSAEAPSSPEFTRSVSSRETAAG